MNPAPAKNRQPSQDRPAARILLILTALGMIIPLLDLMAQILTQNATGHRETTWPAAFWTAVAINATVAPAWCLAAASLFLNHANRQPDDPPWQIPASVPLAQGIALALCHETTLDVATGLNLALSLLWTLKWVNDARQNRSLRAAAWSTAAAGNAAIAAILLAT